MFINGMTIEMQITNRGQTTEYTFYKHVLRIKLININKD